MRKGAAVGYIRTAMPDNTGKLQQQREKIVSYCNKHKLYLFRIFKENGTGGNHFKHQGWSDLEDFLIDSNGNISCLIVPDLDRIGSGFPKVSREISRLKDEYGISILAVQKRVGLKNIQQKGIQRFKQKKDEGQNRFQELKEYIEKEAATSNYKYALSIGARLNKNS